MIGSITKTIGEFLRSIDFVKENAIQVYTANTTEGRMTVNMSLPGILVTVAPSENPTVFISGRILDRITIHIMYMDDLLNYSMSDDEGIYEERRNWAYMLRDELWKNKQDTFFKKFMNANGLNIMYKGMSPYTQKGVLENMEKDIDVFAFIFDCNLFSDYKDTFPVVPLEDFTVDLIGRTTPEPTIDEVECSGMAFPIWNTFAGDVAITELSIHGKTEQASLPTPEVPVPIQSVGDNGLLLSVMQDKTGGDYQLLDIGGAMRKAGYDGVLRSAGDVYDEIRYNGKEWTFQKRIHTNKIVRTSVNANSYILNDSYAEMWFYNFPSDNGAYRPYALCNCLVNSNTQSEFTANSFNTFGSRFYVRLPIIYDTAEKFLDWIDNNEVIVTYAISNDEIPAPVTLDLPVISTYNNQTYFATNTAEVKPRMVAQCQVSKALDYIRDGLIGYYTGRDRSNTDENKTILPDLSGNGNDLTNKNFAYTPMSGFGDGYLQYDGVDDYSLLDVTGKYPVTPYTIFSTLSAVSGRSATPYWSGYLTSSGFKYFGIGNGIERYDKTYGGSAILNGELVETFDISGDENINVVGIIQNEIPNYNLSYITIGTVSPWPQYCANQKMFDTLIYNRVLTDDEIAYNYKVSQQFNGDNFDGYIN